MILTTDSYAADEPEGHTPSKSQYTSKKELLTVIAILIGLGIAAIPVFNGFKEQRDKSVCNSNLKAIGQAMLQYAAVNDDRLPPIYHVGDNGAPFLSGPNNRPYVWASLLQPHMNARDSFECPAAEDDEKMSAIGEDGDFLLTYGMYLPMSAKPHMLLSRPTNTIIFAETSNYGAQESYNPAPFINMQGDEVKYDAFMIGYNDSNFGFSDETKWVTRLAIRDAAKGYDSPGAHARHPIGVHVMFADGHRGVIQPAKARVENLYPDLDGIWRDH